MKKARLAAESAPDGLFVFEVIKLGKIRPQPGQLL